MTDTSHHFLWNAVLHLLEITAEGGVFSLSIALAVFWSVGHAVIKHRMHLRTFGLAAGLAGFVGFVVWRASTNGISDGASLADTAIRSLFFGGYCTAAGWVSIVAATFLWDHTIGNAARVLDRD